MVYWWFMILYYHIEWVKITNFHLHYHSYRPRSEGDNVLGSVRPSVRPSVRLDVRLSLPAWGVCLCVCNQWAYADNCADAVDRLLIQPYSNNSLVISSKGTTKVTFVAIKCKQRHMANMSVFPTCAFVYKIGYKGNCSYLGSSLPVFMIICKNLTLIRTVFHQITPVFDVFLYSFQGSIWKKDTVWLPLVIHP